MKKLLHVPAFFSRHDASYSFNSYSHTIARLVRYMVCVCVCLSEPDSVCVCVCVCVRARKMQLDEQRVRSGRAR